MPHERTNFFTRSSPPPQPPRDDVPHRVNGLDDPGYWEEIERAVANDPHPDDINILPEPELRGAALWVITDAWNSADIPRRPWVARGYLMRGALTVISGAGGGGKSSLMVSWAASMAVGCSLRHLKVPTPLRVATYNVEDDQHEQMRRFSAMLSRLKLAPDAFKGNLAIIGPGQVGTLLTVTRDGVILNTEVMDELEKFVAEFRPDVLMLDPFVELHGAEENDNTSVRAVLAHFRAMAVRHNMAVVLLHHARKGAGDPGDPDTLRGASSIVGAARVVLTLAVMTKEEAETFKIPETERRSYFRLDGAKSNYAPIEEAEWFRREEILLDNDSEDGPADRVAVAWPWEPPSLIPDVTPAQLNEALDIIATPPAGWLYAATRQGSNNKRWAGQVLIDHLGFDERQAATMIAAWLKSGLLYRQEYRDEDQRKTRTGVRVNDSKRPTI